MGSLGPDWPGVRRSFQQQQLRWLLSQPGVARLDVGFDAIDDSRGCAGCRWNRRRRIKVSLAVSAVIMTLFCRSHQKGSSSFLPKSREHLLKKMHEDWCFFYCHSHTFRSGLCITLCSFALPKLRNIYAV